MSVLQVMVSCHFHLHAVGKRLLVGKHRAAESAAPLSPRFVKQLPRSTVVLEELNIYTSLFCKLRASEVSGIVSAMRAAPRAGCLSEPLLDVSCQTLLPGHLRQHRTLPHTRHGQHWHEQTSEEILSALTILSWFWFIHPHFQTSLKFLRRRGLD